MFGLKKNEAKENVVEYSGKVKQVALIPLGDTGNRYVFHLDTCSKYITVDGEWGRGVYSQVSYNFALTQPGDDVRIVIKDGVLDEFENKRIA